MQKIRVLLFSALAVVLAFGILGQQALAQGEAGKLEIRSIAIDHPSPDSTAAAGPGMYQGIVGMGPNPAAPGDWPCFGGPSCAGIASGGLVVGVPLQVWPLASANGQIYWTFQTTSSSGTAHFTIKVTQGSTSILTTTGTITGISTNSLEIIAISNSSFSGAVAGPATITITTKIGTTKIKGTANIVLQ